MKPYPLFIPPLHLAEKNRLAWSNAEANEYKRWLLAHIDERVQELVAYLHESRSETGRGLLRKLGRKTIHLLRNSSFAQSENGEVVLTNEGYALAADM